MMCANALHVTSRLAFLLTILLEFIFIILFHIEHQYNCFGPELSKVIQLDSFNGYSESKLQ